MSTVELNDINERLRSALRMMEELHPRCWREISERRRAYLHGGRGWPDWCYCPLQVIQNFMFRGAVSAPLEVLKAVPILGALATWRQTQGIYCFDPELLEAVTKSELTNELPAALLSKLPEWCVYVPTPGHIVLSGHRMEGFFAYLDCLKTNGRPELWLVLDEETDDGERVFRSFRLLIGSGTLLECLQSSFADAHADMLKWGTNHLVQLSEKMLADIEMQARAAIDLTPVVSCLLYLCSVNAEIRAAADASGERRPRNPQPVRTRRHGERLFPANQMTTWNVGYRFGADLRRAHAVAQSADTQPGTHASPCPHIRRAHFHSFWQGPRDNPLARQLLVKWLPPIMVNVRGDEDLVPTVRRVAA